MDRQPVDLSERLDQLARSRFRARFGLRQKDIKYFQEKGLENIMCHADRFIRGRLAPAYPPRDGSQTPMRGHPVFIAQHATATCCRSCLKRWHGIEKGVDLTESQIAWILKLIQTWFTRQLDQSRISRDNESIRKQKDQPWKLF